METITCALVRAWFDSDVQDQPIRAQLLAHISSCASCRGALLLLTDEKLGTPVLDDVVCERCQEDLPAFVDYNGTLPDAIRTYPHVWWHLSTCPNCREIYELTGVLRDAERTGVLAPPPRLRQVTLPHGQPMKLLALSRQFLNAALRSLILGSATMRGEDALDRVIAERKLAEGLYVSLSVLAQADGGWQITVTTKPPVTGRLLLKLGTASFRSPFQASGVAVITDVPSQLLTEQDGTDLEVAIEPDSIEPDSIDSRMQG